MYAKSARINAYSLSGAASRTLLLTCFPSPLVRWSDFASRRFFPLMSVLDGALECLVSSARNFTGFEDPHQFNQKRAKQSVRYRTPLKTKRKRIVLRTGARRTT